MRQYFLRVSGLAALVLLLLSNGQAQQMDSTDQKEWKDSVGDNRHGFDEIIIKRKNDKDAKVTVEIKDGKVFVNGKPVSEFDDDNVSVRKMKVRVWDGPNFSFSGDINEPDMPDMAIAPRAPNSPFRNKGGAWSIDGDNWSGNAISRAQLGVVSSATTDGEAAAGGAKIKEVSKGSAAEKAGLKAGDLITKVDEIAISGPAALTSAVHKYKPEDKVVITYKRDGKEQKTTATLDKAKNITVYKYDYNYNMPDMDHFDFKMPYPGNGYFYGENRSPRLGIKAQDTEDGKGVKVLEVADESPAAKVGIKEGDIISRFDGKEVNSATALSEAAREARSKPSYKINLTRVGKPMEFEIKTPKKLKTADL
jgi:serine protease Do